MMRYITEFNIFENPDKDIELFEDLLQEYFDKWKLYTSDELEDRLTKETSNGEYSIKRVSTTFFKTTGFPDHRKGILITLSTYKEIAENRESNLEFCNDMMKFTNRIEKMGYWFETSHATYYKHIDYYIAVIDPEPVTKWGIVQNESINYLNKNFEVSEDELIDFSIKPLDVDGFDKRETSQIKEWSNSIGGHPEFYGDPKSSKSMVGIRCQEASYLNIDITKFIDEWYSVVHEDEDDGIIYYIFDNWEDLKERVDKIIYEFNNYYSPEEEERRRSNQIDESIDNDNELVSDLNRDQYNEFWTSHKEIPLTISESEKIHKMLLQTWDESEIEHPVNGFGVVDYNTWWADEENIEIYVFKFEDEWFLVEYEVHDGYSHIHRYFLCDQIDSIGMIDFFSEI